MFGKNRPTAASLFAAWDAGEVSQSRFGDDLWLALTHITPTVGDLPKVAEPVRHWYASRYMEFDVGNGGFAQAAYNIPEWFGAAAEGYRALGLEDCAALIDEAALIVEEERKRFTASDIGELFDQFSESRLDELDRRDGPDTLDKIGWWAADRRMAYTLANREAFLALDALPT